MKNLAGRILLLVLGGGDVVVISADTTRCDESKCRNPHPAGGYGCWALKKHEPTANKNTTDIEQPYLCADGYGGTVVPLSAINPLEGWSDTHEYYTCCPPGYNGTPPPNQQCSETTCSSPGLVGTDCWADGPYEPMTCAGDELKYPRKTGFFFLWSSWYYSQYICCTTSDGTAPLSSRLVLLEGLRVAIGCLALCCGLIFAVALLSSRVVRRQSFNLYLILLCIPDAVFNITQIVVGSQSIQGLTTNVYVLFGSSYAYATANIWLNFIISHQIYSLLCHSKQRRRARPPSVKLVFKQAAVVFIVAAGVGVWAAFMLRGKIVPHENEKGSKWILAMTWVVIALFPFIHLIYVSIRVWRRKLLPKTGPTRIVSIYFLRLILVFFAFWIPTIVMLNVERENIQFYWFHYMLYYLCSFQGMTSLAVSLMKPDIRSAVQRFVTCRWNQEVEEFRPSSYRASSVPRSMRSSSRRTNLFRFSSFNTSTTSNHDSNRTSSSRTIVSDQPHNTMDSSRHFRGASILHLDGEEPEDNTVHTEEDILEKMEKEGIAGSFKEGGSEEERRPSTFTGAGEQPCAEEEQGNPGRAGAFTREEITSAEEGSPRLFSGEVSGSTEEESPIFACEESASDEEGRARAGMPVEAGLDASSSV